ncbi:DUF1189 family protein [Candidatus Woesearchaeota archaeon]|nr:DUF1189 family protein [Candidatus Woesearchaeota archaeon]
MGRLQEFWSMFLTSLNPTRYHRLEPTLSKSLFYFVSMVFMVFLLTSILYIPSLLTLPSYVQKELNKFDSLQISLDYKLKEPIVVPKNNPLIVIDVIDNPKPVQEGIIIITGNELYYQPYPYAQRRVIRNDDNLLQKGNELSGLFGMLAVITAPVIFVAGFLYFFLKYIVIILIASVIGYLLARIAHFGIEYQDMFRVGLHASTAMVVIGLLTRPFIPTTGYLEYIVFMIIFLLGTLKMGDFEEVVHKKGNTHHEHEQYRR